MLCSSCKKEEIIFSDSAFLLDTLVQISFYGLEDADLMQKTLDLCKVYEKKFSHTLEESPIYQMNHRELGEDRFALDVEVEELLEKALTYASLSDGKFDPTIEPLSSLWIFGEDVFVLPDQVELQEAISAVDYQQIKIENHQLIFLSDYTKLNLGGIAKGYIADKLKEFLLSQGIKRAIINLGGNVLCIGRKSTNKGFLIGVQKPFSERYEVVSNLEIDDKTVVSSGPYERGETFDGVYYHHILDPDTGYPVDNALTSVTIITDQSADADAMSTIGFLMGLEKGLDWINSLEGVEAIFITQDEQIFYSKEAKKYLVQVD